jgi:hypothetical protein
LHAMLNLYIIIINKTIPLELSHYTFCIMSKYKLVLKQIYIHHMNGNMARFCVVQKPFKSTNRTK